MKRKKLVVLVMTEEETALAIEAIRAHSATVKHGPGVISETGPKNIALDALLVKVYQAERQKS